MQTCPLNIPCIILPNQWLARRKYLRGATHNYQNPSSALILSSTSYHTDATFLPCIVFESTYNASAAILRLSTPNSLGSHPVGFN